MTVLKTRIFTITGTKGKTSVARALHYAIQSQSPEPVLLVDTHRILLGDKKVATFMQSRETSGLVPTVCPGRFLMSLAGLENPVAVLEASVGSSQEPGLGYRVHEVGIFTNVYDDHIGVKDYLKNREDLARAKSFVFQYIQKGGYAIYNADDALVSAQTQTIPKDKGITVVACTLDGDATVPDGAHYVVTVVNGDIVVMDVAGVVFSIAISAMPWLLGGLHEPSLRNGLSVIAGLLAYAKGDIASLTRGVNALSGYEPDDQGGRMIIRTAKKGTKVIIDFAHEAESLMRVAEYGRHLATGRIIGVVRLSGGRTDEHIASTVERFAPCYDELFIYEKQNFDDGLYKKFNRKPGDVAAIMHEQALKQGVKSTIVEGEKEALELAEQAAGKDDIVIYIIDHSVGSYELAHTIFEFTEKP